MTSYIGLDVGGTKIAGGAFSENGEILCEMVVPTPQTYDAFIRACCDLVAEVEKNTKPVDRVGIGSPGVVDDKFGTIQSTSLPFLAEKDVRRDLEIAMGKEIRIGNDANCMALAEAIDGAGAGYDTVVSLIVGTGVGAGYVRHGQIEAGVNFMTGELGHLPLPFREATDGPEEPCYCGQSSCIEKLISGPALKRLYTHMTCKIVEPEHIAELALAKDPDALQVLDRYYTVFAKAMLTVISSFDPAAIVVSGGMNKLPGLYDEVPKRWGNYFWYLRNPKTKLVPARHGSMAGLRGAAWLWRMKCE